jgi:hypothetical protein
MVGAMQGPWCVWTSSTSTMMVAIDCGNGEGSGWWNKVKVI